MSIHDITEIPFESVSAYPALRDALLPISEWTLDAHSLGATDIQFASRQALRDDADTPNAWQRASTFLSGCEQLPCVQRALARPPQHTPARGLSGWAVLLTKAVQTSHDVQTAVLLQRNGIPSVAERPLRKEPCISEQSSRRYGHGP